MAEGYGNTSGENIEKEGGKEISQISSKPSIEVNPNFSLERSKVLDLNHYRLITPELQNNSEKVGDLNFSIEKMDEIIKNIN